MHFDQLLADFQSSTEYQFAQDWGQGRATFGGVVAALALTAMEKQLSRPRSVQVFNLQFIAPAEFGPVAVEVQAIREGKSVSHMQAVLTQQGSPIALAIASFADGRPSQLHVPALVAPDIDPPEKGRDRPDINGFTPAFIRHFDYRWIFGETPFMASTEKAIGGWIRFRDSDQNITAAHVLSMIDAWPPAALSMMSTPAPASTLNWTVRWTDHPLDFSTKEYCQFHTELDFAHQGIAHSRSFFWAPDGQLIAISEQTDTVFG